MTRFAIDSGFSLEGRNVLVTGATGHLGRSMVFALAAAGAHVLVAARSRVKVSELVKSVQLAGGQASGLVFDATKADDIERVITGLNAPLHVLINNAYSGGAGGIQHATAQDYRDSYEVSLVASHRLVHASLPMLKRAVELDGEASVINVASMYGIVSPDPRIYTDSTVANPPFYGASKAALIQWTRYLACELGPEGIRANSISPGPFPSIATQQADPAFIQRLADRVPLGRIGDAAEIAGPIVFLASHASSFVNGANLIVDGGWTAW